MPWAAAATWRGWRPLRPGFPVSVPGLTVDRQCGSGLDAIVLASRLVAAGGGVYLAGGVESISTAPLRAHRNDDGEPEFFARAQFAPHGYGDPDMGAAAENVAGRLRHQPRTAGRFRAAEPPPRCCRRRGTAPSSREIVPLPGPASGTWCPRTTAPGPGSAKP